MKALILAAGRGERMRELTENTPKPLLKIRGHALIEHRIFALKKAGFDHIVINLFYLGQQIADYLGDGSRYQVKIDYSWEKEKLNVGGGIRHALSLLGNQPFLITSADIDTDYPYATLQRPIDTLAHLVLTDNPDHHPTGDFTLQSNQVGLIENLPRLTYMSVAIFHPDLFKDLPQQGPISFLDCLKPAILQGKVSGEYFNGKWLNLDTPERLALASD